MGWKVQLCFRLRSLVDILPQNQPQSHRHREAAQMAQLSLTKADAQQQQRYHLAIHLAITFSSSFWSNSTVPITGSLFHHLLRSPCCYTALSDIDTYNYHLYNGRRVSPRTLLYSVKARPACLLLHHPLNSLGCTMHHAWDIIALRAFDSSMFSLQSHSCLQKLGIHQWHKTSQSQEMPGKML